MCDYHAACRCTPSSPRLLRCQRPHVRDRACLSLRLRPSRWRSSLAPSVQYLPVAGDALSSGDFHQRRPSHHGSPYQSRIQPIHCSGSLHSPAGTMGTFPASPSCVVAHWVYPACFGAGRGRQWIESSSRHGLTAFRISLFVNVFR